jgi:hypothetical protein
MITLQEKETRECRGHGGYFIQLTKNEILDCYNNRQDGTCKLSFVNSFVRARSSNTSDLAIQNTKLIVNVTKKVASLKTTKYINAHEELFTDYGPNYENVELNPIHLSGDLSHQVQMNKSIWT